MSDSSDAAKGTMGNPAWALPALLLRVGLAGVFLLAAWVKLQHTLVPGALIDVGVPGPVNFADAIRAYRLDLPDGLVSWATYTIPATELLVGVALVLGLWTRAAALLYILLLGVFLVGIVQALSRGLDIKCGCFGDFKLYCDGAVGWCKVGENCVLAALAALLLAFGPGAISLDAFSRPAR